MKSIQRIGVVLGFVVQICMTLSMALAQSGTPGTYFAFADSATAAPTNPTLPFDFASNVVKPFGIYPYDAWDTQPGRHALADSAKGYLNSLPDGRRAIYMYCAQRIADLYLDSNSASDIATIAAMWDDFFCYYKSIGGKVDAIHMDYEGNIATISTLRQAYFIPAQRYYPNIQAMNYDDYRIDSTKYPILNVYGDLPYGPTDPMMGTHQCPVLYGWSLNNMASALDPNKPFKSMVHDIGLLRGIILSNPGIPVRPYVAYSRWNWDQAEGPGRLATGSNVATQTDYYREELLHIALHKPDQFLFWSKEYAAAYNQPVNTFTSQADCNLLSNLLKEMDEVVGYSDRANLTIEPIYDDLKSGVNYLLSGMYAGGRNVWRITPDTGVVSKLAFRTSSTPPTFKVGTTTITFPAGSAILTPTNSFTTVGYWVTSPGGTSPVITGDKTVKFTNMVPLTAPAYIGAPAYAGVAFQANTWWRDWDNGIPIISVFSGSRTAVSGAFTLPANRLLKSIDIRDGGAANATGTVTLSSTGNPSVTFNVNSTWTTYKTNWTKTAPFVTVTVTEPLYAAANVLFTNLTYTSPGATTVNDNTTGTGLNQFNYAGTWSYYNGKTGNLNNDEHYSNATGSSFQVTFYGTKIAYWGLKASSHGKATIQIDGGPATTIDLYAVATSAPLALFTSATLSPGQHTLKVTVSGTKNPSSSGYYVEVDRVVITN